jgi:hypothetical protein
LKPGRFINTIIVALERLQIIQLAVYYNPTDGSMNLVCNF